MPPNRERPPAMAPEQTTADSDRAQAFINGAEILGSVGVELDVASTLVVGPYKECRGTVADLVAQHSDSSGSSLGDNIMDVARKASEEGKDPGKAVLDALTIAVAKGTDGEPLRLSQDELQAMGVNIDRSPKDKTDHEPPTPNPESGTNRPTQQSTGQNGDRAVIREPQDEKTGSESNDSLPRESLDPLRIANIADLQRLTEEQFNQAVTKEEKPRNEVDSPNPGVIKETETIEDHVKLDRVVEISKVDFRVDNPIETSISIDTLSLEDEVGVKLREIEDSLEESEATYVETLLTDLFLNEQSELTESYLVQLFNNGRETLISEGQGESEEVGLFNPTTLELLDNYLNTIEPDKAEHAQELVNNIELVLSSSSETELSEEDRQVMMEELHDLCSELFSTLGIKYDEEIIKKFVNKITNERLKTSEEKQKLSLEYLNEMGTHEYKSNDLGSFVGWVPITLLSRLIMVAKWALIATSS